ncbi:MAG: GAF domain-containing protein [Ahniella sp.]|nr:GAF domain-containing protein [Ahniella sp.]
MNAAVHAELALPIMLRGRVFGVLNLEAQSAAAFTGENRLLLRALADSVAGAIHLLHTANRLMQSQARANRQAEELGRVRENLRRASGKLDRRQGDQSVFGLVSETQFRKRMKAECRAVTRGGRAMTLWFLRLDPGAQNVTPARRNEACNLLANRVSQTLLDPQPCVWRVQDDTIVVLLSGAPGLDPQRRIDESLAQLRQQFTEPPHPLLARCTSLAATCKLSQASDPEAFLASAQAALATVKPGQHLSLDAHHP